MSLTLIAAIAENGVIGAGGTMPWHLPEDLAQFKATTMGHTLIMGRATFEAIGRPLPGRRTIVVTRNPHFSHAGVERAHSLAEAIALAGPGEVFVAGGGQIYAAALPLASRMILTEVPGAPEGDTLFPPWDPRQWREVDRVVAATHQVATYVRAEPGDG